MLSPRDSTCLDLSFDHLELSIDEIFAKLKVLFLFRLVDFSWSGLHFTNKQACLLFQVLLFFFFGCGEASDMFSYLLQLKLGLGQEVVNNCVLKQELFKEKEYFYK